MVFSRNNIFLGIYLKTKYIGTCGIVECVYNIKKFRERKKLLKIPTQLVNPY